MALTGSSLTSKLCYLVSNHYDVIPQGRAGIEYVIDQITDEVESVARKLEKTNLCTNVVEDALLKTSTVVEDALLKTTTHHLNTSADNDSS